MTGRGGLLQKKAYFFLFLLLLLASLLLLDGALAHRALLKQKEAHTASGGPVVSAGFNGTASAAPIGDGRVYWGDISFVLCNAPEKEGRVEQVRLRKLRDGEEVSSRSVYAPWRALYDTLRNAPGEVACDPKVLAVLSPGSQLDYWIEVRMSDGTVYQHHAVRLDRDDMKCNLGTEIYNARGEARPARE